MAKKKDNNKENAYFIWVVIGLIVVFLLAFFIFKEMKVVEYQGLKFTKEKLGEIPLYHYYYLYEDRTGQLVQNNIYLRNNPSKNDVEVDGEILFVEGRNVYVTINSSALEGCQQSAIAISSLASFIANSDITVKGAVMDNSTLDNNSTVPVVSCNTNVNGTVIQVNEGKETKIVNKNKCYSIYFSKCEDVLPAVEKFIVQSIIDAK